MRLYIDGFRGLILKQKMHKNLKKQAFMQKIITEQRFYTLSRYHGLSDKTCHAIHVRAERSSLKSLNTQAVSKCRSTRSAIPSQRKLSDTEWMLKRLLAR